MKKLLKFLVVAFIFFIPFMVNVKAAKSDKINVYLFRGEGCPHCEEALEFFDKLSKDEEYSKYYNLVKYEVWYDEDNAKLMDQVAKKLDTEASGVPFIVIGKKYFSGYASSMDDEIKNAIKTAYEDKDYKDMVKASKSTKKVETKKKNSATVPIIIVACVAAVTVIGMIFFTKEK